MRNLHRVGAKDDGLDCVGPMKLRYDLVPPGSLAALARVLTHGAQVYVPDGWRKVPNARARYTAALMRHLEAWRAGEKLDRKSKLPHLAHVICNAVFLLELDR